MGKGEPLTSSDTTNPNGPDGNESGYGGIGSQLVAGLLVILNRYSYYYEIWEQACEERRYEERLVARCIECWACDHETPRGLPGGIP